MTGATSDDDSAARAVRAAAVERAAALVARDAAGLRRLMHPGLRWTTRLGRVLDLDAYVAANTSGEPRWLGQRLDDVDVTVHDATAVLVCLARDRVVEAGEEREHVLRLTQTWVRDATGWRCLAGHAGRAPGPPDAARA